MKTVYENAEFEESLLWNSQDKVVWKCRTKHEPGRPQFGRIEEHLRYPGYFVCYFEEQAGIPHDLLHDVELFLIELRKDWLKQYGHEEEESQNQHDQFDGERFISLPKKKAVS